MTDIVKELRQASLNQGDYRWQAADEIERLRGEVLHLKHDIFLVKSMLTPGYKYESFAVGMGLKND